MHAAVWQLLAIVHHRWLVAPRPVAEIVCIAIRLVCVVNVVMGKHSRALQIAVTAKDRFNIFNIEYKKFGNNAKFYFSVYCRLWLRLG